MGEKSRKVRGGGLLMSFNHFRPHIFISFVLPLIDDFNYSQTFQRRSNGAAQKRPVWPLIGAPHSRSAAVAVGKL